MSLDEAQWVWETVLSKPRSDNVTMQKVINKLEAYGTIDKYVKEAHKMVNDLWLELEPYLKDNIFKIYLHSFGWYLVMYNSLENI